MENLYISWTQDSKNVLVNKWFKWSDSDLGPDVEPDLNKALDWPPKTLSILERAFQLGLSRFDGWDFRSTSSEYWEAFTQAAKVYKRGVPVFSNEPAKPLSGSYPLIFLTQVKQVFDSFTESAFFIVDQNLWTHWSESIPPVEPLIISSDEKRKTLQQTAEIILAWKQKGEPSHWVIIGGGILSDIVAFAAVLCGVTFTLIPTTLLAIADASVGGKSGVNYPPYGKNQIGVFSFPREVIICSEWLSSLPPRQIRAGMAECVKHGILEASGQLLELLKSSSKAPVISLETLRSVVEVKHQVVNLDPFEMGIRATLNLGHTLGHAIEALSHKNQVEGETILHGEAVAVGLVYMIFLSKFYGAMTEVSAENLLNQIKDFEIVPSKVELLKMLGEVDHDRIWERLSALMQKDKKADTNVRWILMEKSGEVYQQNSLEYGIVVPRQTQYKAWLACLAWFR